MNTTAFSPSFPSFIPHAYDLLPEHRPHALLFINESAMAGVCAWCEDKVEADTWCQEHGLDVTHTICYSCRTRMLDEDRRLSCTRQVA